METLVPLLASVDTLGQGVPCFCLAERVLASHEVSACSTLAWGCTHISLGASTVSGRGGGGVGACCPNQSWKSRLTTLPSLTPPQWGLGASYYWVQVEVQVPCLILAGMGGGGAEVFPCVCLE